MIQRFRVWLSWGLILLAGRIAPADASSGKLIRKFTNHILLNLA